jgi:NodT family efflux transporter outer membrane factor (OMF) lipoprotein
MNQFRAIVFLLALGMILLPGCKVGPDYQEPEIMMPDVWHQKAVEGLAERQSDLQTWWNYLNDPVLSRLMQRLEDGNLDLKTAASRVRQSRAILGIAAGEYWPQVDAAGFYSRDRVSENGLSVPSAGDLDQTNLHSVGVDSVWEIDVFGRISRSVESARASMDASLENYRDVLVILYAETALNYIDVRVLEARIAYARDNIKIQRESLRLAENRYDAGLTPELDVQQARLNLAATESAIPALRRQQIAAMNRLSVLLGQTPGQLREELIQPTAMSSVPEEISVGLPAELLRQRPDIRRAERILAAQTAQVGVATAALYPTFSLSGVFALESQHIDDVGDWDSRTWGFGPAFRWNLFDGNRIRSNIQLEEAIAEEALLQYEQAILLALEEVENAMAAFREEQIRLEALRRSVAAAQKAVELVNDLYLNGLTDFQNVLDMQRALSTQQDQFAESEGLVVQNLVRLYKAVGGGWSLNNPEDTIQ